ncbi:YqfX [Bacillus freudenreichii]|nr:YqfX [Bacillus freudenreichii]
MEQQQDDVNSSKKFDERGLIEETAAEITPDIFWEKAADDGIGRSNILGYTALAMAILSLFFMPGLMGIAGAVFSVIAITRGAHTIGGWALSVALLSLGWRFLIVPFI